MERLPIRLPSLILLAGNRGLNKIVNYKISPPGEFDPFAINKARVSLPKTFKAIKPGPCPFSMHVNNSIPENRIQP